MENSDFQQSVYLVDWTIAGARFTRHRYEGSVVHKSGAIRCSRVAIPLGSRAILRPASLREEARFATAETITGYLDSCIHSIFRLALITVSAIAVPNNQAWLLDKWHLGPLRLLNFLVTGWTFSKVLGHLRCRQCRALSLWHHPWAQHRRVDCVSLAFIRFNLGMPRRKVATGINC
jgi:hypothetical protein